MLRTNIYFSDDQTSSLDRLAAEQGMSRAALIRRIIDRSLEHGDGAIESDLAAIEESFGILESGFEGVSRGPDDRSRHREAVRRKR